MPWLHPTHLSEVFRVMMANMLISKRGMYWNKGEIKANGLSAQVIYQPSNFWKTVKKLAYAHCEQKEQIQQH